MDADDRARDEELIVLLGCAAIAVFYLVTWIFL